MSRFVTNLRDKRHPERWWRPVRLDDFEVYDFVRLPKAVTVGTKKSDSLRRAHLPWTVLHTTDGDQLYPIYAADVSTDKFGMRTWLPLRTGYFAMRIGKDPVQVITVDRRHQVYVPTLIREGGQPLVFRGEAAVRRWAQAHGPITLI